MGACGDAAGYETAVAELHEYYAEALNEREFMQLLGECARPQD